MSTNEYNIDYSQFFEDKETQQPQQNNGRGWLKNILISLVLLASLGVILYYVFIYNKVPDVNVRTAESIELIPSETKVASSNQQQALNITEKPVNVATKTTKPVVIPKKSISSEKGVEIVEDVMASEINEVSSNKQDTQAEVTKAETSIIKKLPKLFNNKISVAALSKPEDEISQPKLAKASTFKSPTHKEKLTASAVNKSQSAEIDNIIKQIATLKSVANPTTTSKRAVLPKDIIASVSSTIQSADIINKPAQTKIEKKKVSVRKRKSTGYTFDPNQSDVKALQDSYQQGLEGLVTETDLESVYNTTF